MNGRVRPRLVIMVKEPRAGRVKSRLARDAGVVAATRFLRSNVASTLARAGRDPRWQTLIAVSPDSALRSPMFPQTIVRLPQGGGDLGRRLTHVSKIAPPGPLIVIGADIPGICPSSIAAAFRLLRAHDGVFGPSGDGGYWLVGLSPRARRTPPFKNVRWSTEHALADTLANLKDLRTAMTATKDDVDRGHDLQRLGTRAGRVVYGPSY